MQVLSSNRSSVRSGISLPECLVVIGVLAVVIALLLPSLSKARSSAQVLDDVARIRQQSVCLAIYALDFRDCAPALYAPDSIPSGNWSWKGEELPKGGWFANAAFAWLPLIEQGMDERLVAARGVQVPPDITAQQIVQRHGCFSFTNTLYAAPEYFNLDTRSGDAQYDLQPLSRVLFPSSKGLIVQHHTWVPGVGLIVTCCINDAPAAVSWADGSASAEILRRLRRGVANAAAGQWHSPSVDPRTIGSGPIKNTVDGVRGHDR
jgi:type II secretory pathway pseudopilin PulG